TLVSFFFFTATSTTDFYTLSLHDALPISLLCRAGLDFHKLDTSLQENTSARFQGWKKQSAYRLSRAAPRRDHLRRAQTPTSSARSEEHTSELQSQSNLVCRLLLEKKKNHT